MDAVLSILPLLLVLLLLEGIHCQGVYAPPSVRIVHSGNACNVEEERFSERVYTIREGETLQLTCLVTGHPRPQIRWTKTAGSVSERFPDTSVLNETLLIQRIQRNQGGRYYCKAENGVGTPAIRSIRVDVYYLDAPVVSVHQSVAEARDQFYSERTVFLRCAAEANPAPRYSWRRDTHTLAPGTDKGVEIYQPFFTQGETKILKLKNLRPKDYANYSCIASVRSICAISDRSTIFRLTNKTAPPTIRLLVEDPVVVSPGQTVSLVCVLTAGEPVPDLIWAGPGVNGSLPERSVVKDGTLTLPSVVPEDAGMYSCIANNHVGNPARKSTTLIIRALRNGRFWITPDPYHTDDSLQLGREVRVSCSAEAEPVEELIFSWMKNGRPLRSSERMLITHSLPEHAHTPAHTHLDIIDLKFTDFGTYTCAAALRGGGVPEISIDVNISSTTAPPSVSVPLGRSPLLVREGDPVELECVVSGKPKPIILWSRADRETPLPDGTLQSESVDGVLRIANVSRDMTGSYRCQTSQYNGFNVKPREAVIQLIVQYPPVLEPAQQDLRQALDRPVSLSCHVIRAHPWKILRFEWRFGSKLLTAGHLTPRSDLSEYRINQLTQEREGEYHCEIYNEAGAGRCSFTVTGKAFAPEFYYDTYNPLWQNRPRVYDYKLQWTQMNPDAVDRIMAYKLGFRQVGQQRWWEQEIPVHGVLRKGELLTHNLTELMQPQSYEIRLSAITRCGEGDTSSRFIHYSPPTTPHLKEFSCGFEQESICSFSQDLSDDFDWTRHSAATRDAKYTPNTGPSGDRSGSRQGFFMYIETSRPRKEGDTARLLTPVFNIPSKNLLSMKSPGDYCLGFYYHMYGKHIGSLNVFVKQKSSSEPGLVWSLHGNQGDRWSQARVSIRPSKSFQVTFEGIRGPGIEGDIAIDDVTMEEGECPDPPSNPIRGASPDSISWSSWSRRLSFCLFLSVLLHLR